MKAFPTHREEGVALRDYFAAKAMQGLLANGSMPAELDSLLVERAYTIADYMMEERRP